LLKAETEDLTDMAMTSGLPRKQKRRLKAKKGQLDLFPPALAAPVKPSGGNRRLLDLPLTDQPAPQKSEPRASPRPPPHTLSGANKHLTEPNPELARLIKWTPDGMAYWAGTGPSETTCGSCLYYEYFDAKGKAHWNRCLLFYASTKTSCKTTIAKRTPSCKYFRKQLFDA
jgi:hypothetical protein